MHHHVHIVWSEAAAFIFGMALHTIGRVVEWRRRNRGKSDWEYGEFLILPSMLIAKILSLGIMVVWVTDFPVTIPGTALSLTPSHVLPHERIMAFVIGYCSDSLVKGLVLYIRAKWGQYFPANSVPQDPPSPGGSNGTTNSKV